MPYIYLPKNQTYHVTVDFHEIKCWIRRHKATPALITKNGKVLPHVFLQGQMIRNAQKIPFADFLVSMLDHELAFKYDEKTCEIVSQDEYIDEIQDL